MNQSSPKMMERVHSSFMTWFIAFFVLMVGGIGFFMFCPLIRTWSYEPVTGIVVQSEMEYCGMEASGYSEEIRFAYTVGNRKFRDGRLRRDFARMCEPESLDWELDEQSDESLDTDDDPSELNEPLMLGRLFDVLESLEPLLDESLD